MLEILGILLLCKVNKTNAIGRGRKPGGFLLLTVCLWLFMELLGAVIGVAAGWGIGIYALALAMAAVGGLISYVVTKNCRQGENRQSAQSPKVRFCNMCGVPIPESAGFCTECGAPRVGAVIPNQIAEAGKKCCRGFDKCVAIFNLVLDGIVSVFLLVAMAVDAELVGEVIAAFVFFAAVTGIAVYALACRKQEYPKWLRIVNIVLFALSVGLLLLIAILQI